MYDFDIFSFDFPLGKKSLGAAILAKVLLPKRKMKQRASRRKLGFFTGRA